MKSHSSGDESLYDPLLSMIAGWMNRKQQAVIDYLVEENGVLKAQLQGQRPKLTDEIRRRLAIKGKSIGWNSLCGIDSYRECRDDLLNEYLTALGMGVLSSSSSAT